MFSYESMKTKRNISLLFGIIFTAYGAAALASSFGIALPVPSMLFMQIIVEIALVAAGLLLLYDSVGMISMQTGRISFVSIITGLILAAVGAFPLLLRYGLLVFLPFNIEFSIVPQIPAALLVFFGIYLLAMYRKLRMIAYQYGMY
ncbi:MAG: hypothetical protein ABIB71_08215 [Candidatus Woesearchaeota archaeon]